MGNTTTGFEDNVVIGVSNMTAADIARVAHEANRAFCAQAGDLSHEPFAATPENIQRSIIDGVLKIASGEVANPRTSHAAWCAYKLAEGWCYGPTKDFEAKTHPCLVPYDELPEHDRVKDHLFGAIVRTLLGQGAAA